MNDPQMQTMMQRVSGMMTQGGIMPDDVETLAQEAEQMPGGIGGLFDPVQGLFGEQEYEEIDLDEEVAAYEPEAVDAGDRAFVTELTAWLKDTISDLPASDVCMLEIGYHLGYSEDNVPGGDLWVAYNTQQTDAENRANDIERWNFANWTDNCFRSMDAEPLTEWLESQGYDLEEDDDELTERIYDLAVAAVMELHRENFTEQRFGKKLPFIIEDYEYNQKTAIRAVKANGGRELFDQTFFNECGFADDEEDAE
jgi:hypothetical protein